MQVRPKFGGCYDGTVGDYRIDFGTLIGFARARTRKSRQVANRNELYTKLDFMIRYTFCSENSSTIPRAAKSVARFFQQSGVMRNELE